VTSPQIS